MDWELTQRDRYADVDVDIKVYGVRPVCRLHFGPKIIFALFLVENASQKSVVENVPKMFFFIESSSSPCKKANNVVSTRKNRQQTVLKAIWRYMLES